MIQIRNSPALDAFWMPFTANRQFKRAPRLLASASGMYYRSADGREIMDGTAGLWCVNAGNGRAEIVDAVAGQLRTMDYAPSLQMGHERALRLAGRPADPGPAGSGQVCFSGWDARLR